MNIIVLGKGGREHALIKALKVSSDNKIYAFPGSDAIFEDCIKIDDNGGIKGLSNLVNEMRIKKIDLCVVGQESYLMEEEGIAKLCKDNDILCWGPDKYASQLESSKEFAKKFMIRNKIPTAKYVATNSAQEAKKAINNLYPVALKFDGLAAGKGVEVCFDESSADKFINKVLVERKFGEGPLLVEDFLQGEEISIFVSVSNGNYHILGVAKDYKRIFDNNKGPNTGGMGAVSSLNIISDSLFKKIEDEIIKTTVSSLNNDGIEYTGFLYFGIILTDEGPKVLEYNCRFGDPEAECVLPLIKGDFAKYIYEASNNNLDSSLINFSSNYSICIVLASSGYPESYRNGDVISGLDDVQGCQIFHAGTRKNEENKYETFGGRVLIISSQALSKDEAIAKVYKEIKKIRFLGMQKRMDIGGSNL